VRVSRIAEHLEDLAEPFRLTEVVSLDHDEVTGRRSDRLCVPGHRLLLSARA
jgi:hypothetical protein